MPTHKVPKGPKGAVYDVYLTGHGRDAFSKRYTSLTAANTRCVWLEECYGAFGYSAYIKTIVPPEKRKSDCGTLSA